MLYLIIPPLVFIIGTAVLIFFLFKKVSASPEGREILAAREESIIKKTVSGASRKIVEFFLKITEILARKFKLYSLKFHNSSQHLFQIIRKKREERSSRIAEQEAREQREKTAAVKDKTNSDTVSVGKITEIKKIPSPTISRTAVLPETRMKNKSQMEEALIERIASNPQDIEAYERLGDYYMEQSNYSESLECFRHVLKLSPVHRKAKIRIKRLEKMLGK